VKKTEAENLVSNSLYWGFQKCPWRLVNGERKILNKREY
jgi:hypothetical protein